MIKRIIASPFVYIGYGCMKMTILLIGDYREAIECSKCGHKEFPKNIK